MTTKQTPTADEIETEIEQLEAAAADLDDQLRENRQRMIEADDDDEALLERLRHEREGLLAQRGDVQEDLIEARRKTPAADDQPANDDTETESMTETNNTTADDAQNDHPTLADYTEGDRIDPDDVADKSMETTDNYSPLDAPDDQIAVVYQRSADGHVVTVLYDARTDLYAVTSSLTRREAMSHAEYAYSILSIGSDIRADVTALHGDFADVDGDAHREWLETEAPKETVYGNHNWYYADSGYGVRDYSVFDDSEGACPDRFRFEFTAVDA